LIFSTALDYQSILACVNIRLAQFLSINRLCKNHNHQNTGCQNDEYAQTLKFPAFAVTVQKALYLFNPGSQKIAPAQLW
jgi:hypothetical protein